MTLWDILLAEARDCAQREPRMQAFFEAAILARRDLAEALGRRLASKLAGELGADMLAEWCVTAYHDCAALVRAAEQDLIAAYDRDPACRYYLTPLLFFKGYQAIQAQRLAHYLWQHGENAAALYLQHMIAERFAVDIHPAARIGVRVLLDHATGFVAGETAVIEDDVSLLHGVTLGGVGSQIGDRHPKVRAGAFIGAGAMVLGNIEVGRKATIGASSVVLKPVAPGTTVVGVPAQPVRRDLAD